MKKLAIQTKLILWYTALVAVLLGAALAFLFFAAGKTAALNAKSTLTRVTQDMTHEIELEHDGTVDIDDDFRTYDRGVVLLAFHRGVPIAGDYPAAFPQQTALQPGDAFSVSAGADRFLVQDIAVDTALFVRGIYPLREGSATWNQVLLLALLAFPLLVLIAALGGRRITRRAFAPVAEIARTAGEIGTGDDLARRIGAPDAGDEISALSRAFDAMLDRLETAFADETQFTSDVSHELRTPLAVLKSQCEFALTQPANEQVRAALCEMLAKIDHMTALVARLLELSRAEHSAAALQMEPVDLSELLELVTEELTPRAQEKSIALAAVAESAISLRCEQTLIMRLMLNLIENAIKYTPAGGHVTATLQSTPDAVLLHVTDDGDGIADAAQSKLFRRFYQVSTARTARAGDGFGLGLPLCRWIAEAHGGTIAVQSAPGKGSTFTARFPR